MCQAPLGDTFQAKVVFLETLNFKNAVASSAHLYYPSENLETEFMICEG
jgi:hypothetical protein